MQGAQVVGSRVASRLEPVKGNLPGVEIGNDFGLIVTPEIIMEYRRGMTDFAGALSIEDLTLPHIEKQPLRTLLEFCLSSPISPKFVSSKAVRNEDGDHLGDRKAHIFEEAVDRKGAPMDPSLSKFIDTMNQTGLFPLAIAGQEFPISRLIKEGSFLHHQNPKLVLLVRTHESSSGGEVQAVDDYVVADRFNNRFKPGFDYFLDQHGITGVEIDSQKTALVFIDSNTFDCIIQGLKNPERRERYLQEVTVGKEAALSAVCHLLDFAMKERASDIQVQPRSDGRWNFRLKIDGSWRDLDSFDQARSERKIPYINPNLAVAMISIIKNACGSDVNIAEKRALQNGAIHFNGNESVILGNKATEHFRQQFDKHTIRVSIVPVLSDRENVVLRILPPSNLKSLDEIGLQTSQRKIVRKLMSLPEGIIFVTGPTGSGKTTTIHAALMERNAEDCNVMSIEHPVEIHHDGINQVSFSSHKNVTFVEAQQQFLRHAPDVIFVGELRKPDEADAALQAANTGHLVITTLHTNSALSSLARILDMDLSAGQIADSVKAVIAQRLVKTFNLIKTENGLRLPSTVEEYDARGQLADLMSVDIESLPESIPLYRAVGNDPDTFKGVSPVVEIWVPNQATKAAIVNGERNTDNLYRLSKDDAIFPFKPMVFNALELVLQRRTSLDAILKEIPNTDFMTYREEIIDFLSQRLG